MHDKKKPLITFALIAYNQSEYIEEAVRGALSQTYHPLEIIFSDDSSIDGTFEKINSLVINYNGPHKIKINRTRENLGLCEHLNKIVQLAEGELLVLAAGDDISEPHRTEAIVNAWVENGRTHDSLWSSVTLIDECSIKRGEWIAEASSAALKYKIKNMVPEVIGCSHAVTKRSLNFFGSLPKNVVYEDRVLAFRSLLLGGLLPVHSHLVRYRIHSSSITSIEKEKRGEKSQARHSLHQSRKANVLRSFKIDLHKAQNGFSKLEYFSTQLYIGLHILICAIRSFVYRLTEK